MAPPPGTESTQSPLHMFGMLFLFFAVFYVMLIRPQQRKEKERRKMLEAVKRGDRVLFSGGILGTVSNVKDRTVVVKIAENVKIEVSRGSINAILEKGEDVQDVSTP